MRALFASSLVVIVAAAGSSAVADEVQRSYRFDTAGIERLHIDYRVGDLVLAPADGDQIEVELRIEPEHEGDPAPDLTDVNLTFRVREDQLTLRFSERDVRSHMLVRLPSLEQLTIEAKAGEIRGTLLPMETDVRLDFGSVDLEFDRSSTGRVALRARIGDTVVQGVQNVETSRVLLVGSTTSAAGEGSYGVKARVHAGEVSVALR
ncbi:MAG TPA: hypothetical protein VFL30_03440 [Rhodanobacteraceae bacterium]|nr:hypothetical protein [Rhodanobacteraceae bacterium]